MTTPRTPAPRTPRTPAPSMRQTLQRPVVVRVGPKRQNPYLVSSISGTFFHFTYTSLCTSQTYYHQPSVLRIRSEEACQNRSAHLEGRGPCQQHRGELLGLQGPGHRQGGCLLPAIKNKLRQLQISVQYPSEGEGHRPRDRGGLRSHVSGCSGCEGPNREHVGSGKAGALCRVVLVCGSLIWFVCPVEAA
jgi:hypothetical protein